MIQKLKKLLLDPQYQDAGETVPTQRERRRRQPSRDHRPSHPNETVDGGIPKSAYVALLLLVPVALFVLLSNNRDADIPTDPATLCPIDGQQITKKTYILIDLSEPLSGAQRKSLQSMLKATSDSLIAREQLSINQLQTVQNNPRKEVQLFCSPDISRIGQAGKRVTTEDCPEIIESSFAWPPSLGDAERDDIKDACEDYEELRAKVEEASHRYASVNIEQPRSYIVGAIEDIMHEANDEPSSIPTRLIVFSDMLQNADWFSEYRKSHGEWTIENLRDRRRNTTSMEKEIPDNNFNEVLLCYLPSNHPILATARNKQMHKHMWDDYFEKAKTFRSASDSGCAAATNALVHAK